MAARILGVKRPLDLEGLNDALPPTTCSGAAHHLLSPDMESESFLAKRARMTEIMAASASAAGVPVTARENPFPKSTPAELDEELEGVMAALQSPSKRDALMGSATNEKKYSLEDVKAIVTKVVGQRETVMREEYNKILHAKLAEQFSSFTKFNQDYISRMVKGNTFSYVS